MSTDFVEFRQLQEVGIFSYLVCRGLDGCVIGLKILWMRICKGLDGCVIGLKIFEPSEEIHTCVAMNSADQRVSLFM